MVDPENGARNLKPKRMKSWELFLSKARTDALAWPEHRVHNPLPKLEYWGLVGTPQVTEFIAPLPKLV